MSTNKVGLLGGSFNPPHSIHYQIARVVREALRLDEVWMAPLFNPLKSKKTASEDIDNMLRLGGKGHLGNNYIHFISSSACPAPPHTASSVVSHFESLFPEIEFWWIMGSDELWSLPKWPKWRKLLDPNLHIAVFHRVGYNPFFAPFEVLKELQKTYSPKSLAFISSNVTDEVSSSLIRNCYETGKGSEEPYVQFYLHQAVRDYIDSHGLYRPLK